MKSKFTNIRKEKYEQKYAQTEHRHLLPTIFVEKYLISTCFEPHILWASHLVQQHMGSERTMENSHSLFSVS